MPIGKMCFSWFGALVWIGVVFAALKVVADRFPDLKAQSQGILATGNLFWLYVALVLIKTIHEFGHAIIQFALSADVLGLKASDLNLVTAVLVTLALVLPRLRGGRPA
jgi:hypothetical protein